MRIFGTGLVLLFLLLGWSCARTTQRRHPEDDLQDNRAIEFFFRFGTRADGTN